MRARFPWHHVVGILTGLAIVIPAGSLPAQQGEAADDEAASAARLKAMEVHARSIRVTQVDGQGATAPVPLVPEPILRYDDKPRNIFDATLWAWGPKGRPAAILKVENFSRRPAQSRWIYGIVSLSSDPVRIEGDESWQWQSSEPGLELREVPKAPAPAATEPLRLIQMKELARRFAVHQNGGRGRGRLQLRLLPRPVRRYADPDSSLQDGAVFGFVYGTNPDLLLVLESSRQGEEPPRWRYGLARLGGSATFVDLDDREVASFPVAFPPPLHHATYMNRYQRDRADRP